MLLAAKKKDVDGITPQSLGRLVAVLLGFRCATPLGITRIDAGPEAIMLQFMPKPPIDPAKIIELVQKRKDARFAGPDRIRIDVSSADVPLRAVKIRELLKSLT